MGAGDTGQAWHRPRFLSLYLLPSLGWHHVGFLQQGEAQDPCGGEPVCPAHGDLLHPLCQKEASLCKLCQRTLVLDGTCRAAGGIEGVM